MNLGSETVISSLVCPFTGNDLIELGQKEIDQLNTRISQGHFFFYQGAPVNVSLKKAYVSSNRTYIYPVIDEVIFLKKITSIVPKNRTQNPHKRTSEESINKFYAEFGFGQEFQKLDVDELELKSNPVSLDQLRDLGKLLPKKGSSFVSIVTHDIDSIHNLVFGRNFDNFIHMDFSYNRLRSVVGRLNQDTVYVLGDMSELPLKTDSVDAMFSFDYINKYDKNTQKEAYAELKRSMVANGASVLLYDRELPLHTKGQHSIDKLATKTLKVVAPWKKAKVTNFYFYPISRDQTAEHQNFVGKTSLGSQFSV